MNAPAPFVDSRQVRRNFARAAASGYDAVAVLQREINTRMLERLDYVKIEPERVLDLGCGTGASLGALSERYAKSQVLGTDVSEAMLHAGRKEHSRLRWLLPFLRSSRKSSALIAADTLALPFTSGSMGLIWSNLMLHWLDDPVPAFREIHRVLNVGGLLMFSTFGPDTLKELRQSFAQVDAFSHVNRFIDMHDIGDLLVHNGFSTPVMDMEYITLTYPDVTSVMRDLKAIGAHNVTLGRNQGMMGKNKWQKAIAEYEKLRRDGKLPATYEVVYGHAWKPQSRKSVLTPETRRQLGLMG